MTEDVVHRTVLPPGEALFLHTDGVPDARDASGAFFALPTALDASVVATELREGALCAESLAAEMRLAVLQHTRGRVTDDMALLVLHRETSRAVESMTPGLGRSMVIYGRNAQTS